MTSIVLPETRGIKLDKIHMIDYGGQLRPQTGGVVQTLYRLGTRHSVEFTLPTMRAEPDGRIWSTQLRLAKLSGARLWFRQDGFNIGAPGSGVTVNGAGQSGSTLVIHGFASSSYIVQAGQAFSLISGGRRYLHFAAADTAVDGFGNVTLPIFPMLRVIPANGDVCEFAKPYIEGSLSGNEIAFERLPGGYFNFGTLTITEDA